MPPNKLSTTAPQSHKEAHFTSNLHRRSVRDVLSSNKCGRIPPSFRASDNFPAKRIRSTLSTDQIKNSDSSTEFSEADFPSQTQIQSHAEGVAIRLSIPSTPNPSSALRLGTLRPLDEPAPPVQEGYKLVHIVRHFRAWHKYLSPLERY